MSIAWDFGDGSPAGSGPEVTHTYSTPGTYEATATQGDLSDSTEVTVPLWGPSLMASVQQASLEDDAPTEWRAWANTAPNITLVRSTDQGRDGAASLLATRNATTGSVAVSPANVDDGSHFQFPVTEGKTYTFLASVRVSVPTDVRLDIVWLTATPVVDRQPTAANVWVDRMVRGVAPAGITGADLTIWFLTPVEVGTQCYVDRVGFYEGVPGPPAWVLP